MRSSLSVRSQSDLGDLGEQWCFERVQLAVCLLGSVSRPFKLCQSDGGSAQGSIRFGSATACIFIGVEWRALIDTGWPPEQQPHAAGWVVADCVAGAGSLLAAGSSE